VSAAIRVGEDEDYEKNICYYFALDPEGRSEEGVSAGDGFEE
jgi:hypothetical protein